MQNPVRNRSEILFIYDVTDANPNGDPLDENRPRIDEETGQNIVTDVRLKRTVRDYLHAFKGLDVFVLGIPDENGKLITKEKRQDSFSGTAEVLEKCIDLRLFGATIAVEKKTLTLTGPVQFKFGRSLHPVDTQLFRGTTVMPSAEQKAQGTFWEAYILPYSLIAFYGVVNENAARLHQQAGRALEREVYLYEEDVKLLLEGLWEGTKNLISRSKFGQMPRLLLHVIHKEKNYHIGELDKLVALNTNGKDGRSLRRVSELALDVTPLANRIGREAQRILKIQYLWDPSLVLEKDGSTLSSISDLASGIEYEELSF
jgi:CRISPR-associated protein Csh2